MRTKLMAIAVAAGLALATAGCGSGGSSSGSSSGASATNPSTSSGSSSGTETNSGSGASSTSTSTPVTLRVGSDPVSTFDYAKSNVGYASGMGGLILEPLLVFDSKGQLTPWLAESWKTVSPTKYVYHIRKGVKFSDGNELTAQDVVFSYDHYRADGSADGYNFPDALDTVEATDKYTVTIKLSKPYSAWQFVPAGSTVGIFEKSFYESHKDTFGQPGTGVVGTGPWQLKSFNPTSGATLTANPNYWGKDQSPIQKIDWKFYSSETSSALAFRAGEVDLVMPSDSQAFVSTADTKLIRAPGVKSTAMFAMNVLQKPWDDIHVRRAVAYALNKENLIKAGGVYASPLDTFIPAALLQGLGSPEDVKAALADVPTYHFDLTKAKQEMAKSAYPDGTTATIRSTGEAPESKISQAIAAQLGKIGLKVSIKVMTPEASTAMKLSSDREAILASFGTYGGIGMDPGQAFDFAIGSKNATKGNWNTSNWSNDAVDNLIAQGFATSDPAKRLQIYAKMLKEFGENVPFVPVYLADQSVALSKNFTWPGFNAYWKDAGPWALQLQPAS